MELLQGISEEKVKTLIEKLVSDAVARFVRENEQRAKELSVIERVIKLEEELKALREVQITQIESMDKRFETLQREMDKRFETLQREMDRRFEALQREMDKRFETLQREMDRRFEALQREMDKRFEALEKRFSFMQWFMGIGFSIIVILMSLFKFVH